MPTYAFSLIYASAWGTCRCACLYSYSDSIGTWDVTLPRARAHTHPRRSVLISHTRTDSSFQIFSATATVPLGRA